jgi:hypothetical protein
MTLELKGDKVLEGAEIMNYCHALHKKISENLGDPIEEINDEEDKTDKV